MAQENTARVITIAATEQPQDIRLRVAAYARVSSSSDEQLNSFAAQNRYYTELISGKDNWQLVDIYADEGITGTSIEKRDDFKRIDIYTVRDYSRLNSENHGTLTDIEKYSQEEFDGHTQSGISGNQPIGNASHN